MILSLRSALAAFTFLTLANSRPTSGYISAATSTHESGGEEHIVIVNKNAPITPQVAEVLQRLDLHESHPDVRHVFNNSVFQGFAASMKSHCLDLLANMSDISHVEKTISISHASIPTTMDVRGNAPWGLQRISTANRFSGSPSAMDYTYAYTDSNLGSGSDIYILDTGVYTAHNVFSNRAKMLWSYDNDLSDQDGHGTHVSGTAAGNILGVASNANIFGVKTLSSDGSGWSSNVVAGIDFAIKNHEARSNSQDHSGSVISMSLASSSPVDAINAAVFAAISSGIHVCVAAGNSATDACSSSPAGGGGSQGGAITVGAVDISNTPASFSNYGSCVDVYAPGVNVISSWIGAPNMVNSLSGTSMATPHVTGIIAYAMAANSTLAKNPGLMKEWVRMQALEAGDGVLVANNGVQGAYQNQRKRGEEKGLQWRFARRAFSGLDALMVCARSEKMAVTSAWLCNAKRSLGL
ncbi:Subtilisin-like protease 2 [Pseudocercospora fuligena]|uniref:Subtilisin-like protease 2 n=1 Tax=Pseudocercospora fuligena TaxID=685502 RepID=A0A8H6VHA9_9PEZI|nr:Subtilisin-like protease 2 [Pseudocercospora fuligena]